MGQGTPQVEEATAILPHQDLGTRRQDGRRLVRRHGRRDLRLLDGEGATETAALLGVIRFHHLQVRQAGEQLRRRVGNAHLPARGTGVMERDLEGRSQVGVPPIQDPRQIIRQFVDPPRQAPGALLVGTPGEQLGILNLEHARAGGRGHQDGVILREGGQLPPGDVPGRGLVAGVVGRLTAAGLPLGIDDLQALATQQAHGRQAGLGKDQVDQAGAKEVDAWGMRHGRWGKSLLARFEGTPGSGFGPRP